MNTRLTGNQYWPWELGREPTNEKDVNAIGVVRANPDQVQTKRAVDLEQRIRGHRPRN